MCFVIALLSFCFVIALLSFCFVIAPLSFLSLQRGRQPETPAFHIVGERPGIDDGATAMTIPRARIASASGTSMQALGGRSFCATSGLTRRFDLTLTPV
jgi:hypothetical protein